MTTKIKAKFGENAFAVSGDAESAATAFKAFLEAIGALPAAKRQRTRKPKPEQRPQRRVTVQEMKESIAETARSGRLVREFKLADLPNEADRDVVSAIAECSEKGQPSHMGRIASLTALSVPEVDDVLHKLLAHNFLFMANDGTWSAPGLVR